MADENALPPITSDAEFNRYSISLRDFEGARAYLNELEKHLANSLAYEALLFAAIVSYCRPFTGNEKSQAAGATSRLDFDGCGEFALADRSIHEECMLLRNKALAHSEISFNPTRFDTESGIVSSRPFSLFTFPFKADRLTHLVNHMIEVCHRKRGDYVSRARNQ